MSRQRRLVCFPSQFLSPPIDQPRLLPPAAKLLPPIPLAASPANRFGDSAHESHRWLRILIYLNVRAQVQFWRNILSTQMFSDSCNTCRHQSLVRIGIDEYSTFSPIPNANTITVVASPLTAKVRSRPRINPTTTRIKKITVVRPKRSKTYATDAGTNSVCRIPREAF